MAVFGHEVPTDPASRPLGDRHRPIGGGHMYNSVHWT